MSKMIAYDQDAFKAIRRGVAALSRAVKRTLGPRGRNVLLQENVGTPVVTKDGVTVAKEIELDDPFEKIGAQMVRQVAAKTNDVAGDGTTTATVLAEAIFNEGIRAVVAGIRPVHMKQVNSLRGTFQCCAGKAPAYGDRRKAMQQDIAVLTGGTAVFESLDIKLESLPLTDLGRAQKVIVDKDHTTIIQRADKRKAIDDRIAQIQLELKKATSDYDREKLEERTAKLTWGVAKINVGAATESELKEKKYLYEDAINAVKAASAEEIVAGGGVALLRASIACTPQGLSHDEEVGYNIVRKACRWPITCIAENGGQDGSLICEKVAEKSGNFGYNAMTDTYEDLVKAGVIDPTKVVRSELENAASVAILSLTSDALIAEKPKEDTKQGYGGDDDMY